MWIAPAMIPLIFVEDAQGTIGKDRDIAESLINRGLSHVDCEVDDIIVDEQRKLVSTPAYMLATSLVEAASGINKLVKKVISLS
jgi:enhancing lycopene biosynthesis protein 2